MKTKIEKLEWDSFFFNFQVGSMYIDSHPINEITPNASFDVIYVNQNTDFPLQLKGFTKLFQETKIVFAKPIDNAICLPSIEVIDFDEKPLPNDMLYELAYLSGHYSRFLLDSNFGTEKFKELYRMWVDNSVNKKFAKKIFYTKNNNIITGFVTYQENNGIGKIGLIATHSQYQGKGLGKKLIICVEQYCRENGIKVLEIPTQKENVNACRFYTACGYTIKEHVVVKHYWNK